MVSNYPYNKIKKQSIFGLAQTELQEWLAKHGHPLFHSNQIMQWIYQRNARSFDEMTNLSKTLRQQLNQDFTMDLPAVIERQHDPADGTIKFLLELADKECIEAVAMLQHAGKKSKANYTLCLSTQAGCMFACRFCASGQMGLKRDLTTAEIVAQALLFKHENIPFSRIVFMGTGEPLHNFEELQKTISLFCAKETYDFSPRRLTVSTVGLVPEIYRMAMEDWKVKLAVSLHATSDSKREKLIPLARVYQLDQLMDSLLFYQKRNKRRITFEYLMIDNWNDRQRDAERLVKYCDGIMSHINLIPFNPVSNAPYQPSSHQKIERFKNWLLKNKIDATIRYSRGRNIDAACGQLRLRRV